MKRLNRHWGWAWGLFVVMAWAFAIVSTSDGAGAQGKTIELFNGKDLSGWKGLGSNNEWKIVGKVGLDSMDKKKFHLEAGQGIMVNGDPGNTTYLLSEFQHGDCELHIEFNVPLGSNSGVYFQGLYEIQVFDSYGKEKVDYSDCGGIYARYKDEKTYEGHAPRVNASKAPGEWQSFDVMFRAPRFDANGKKVENARFVKVVHNGVTVHENVDLTGSTRAALEKPEAAEGPLMLQGDHGPVAYRNIRIKPLDLK